MCLLVKMGLPLWALRLDTCTLAVTAQPSEHLAH